jgi:hypothetical protein
MIDLIMKYLILSDLEAKAFVSSYEGTPKDLIRYVYQSALNQAYCGADRCTTPRACAAAVKAVDIEFKGLL